MGAQERTEKVLRDIHVLFSKAKPSDGTGLNVIVNKNEMLELLKELNSCMYDMMDEYEITAASRDKANREAMKEQDEKVLEATKKAEDVYAASIIYTDNALGEIQKIIEKASDDMERICRDMKSQLEDEKQVVRTNQSELKSQLTTLIDTQKYLNIIDEENARKRKEDKGYIDEYENQTQSPYADIVPDIKINEDYFRANGIPFEEEEEKKPEKESLISGEDLDAEYFAWQDEEKEKKDEKKPFFSLW